METRKRETDVLIIGGGAAGCFAALTLGKKGGLEILLAEKANIKRSGCLAAGVNALNAYITKGHKPQDYVDYAKRDAAGIVREDLLLTMSERLNHVTEELEKLGLVILKDENGEYVTRGDRNLKINGENIKPILAKAVRGQKQITVINHVNITDLKLTEERGEKRACGAYGFDVNEEIFYDIDAKAVICATGGAAGLYRPNNPGFSRHKMWYPPFNTGAGYAMGILAGAEMTTFEMRFIALRCKDTIAPTGTIAQGLHAKQVNADGEVYEDKYGLTTSQRVYGTVMENRAGRGPCCLRTEGITEEQEQDLYRAYLNMAPSQTLRWLESGGRPSKKNVEIEGSEPYVVGGHTASGYWVDTGRQTTVTGLFAAGDVAGGSPQKYVTGALAEGEIAAESAAKYVERMRKDVAGDLPQDIGREKITFRDDTQENMKEEFLDAGKKKIVFRDDTQENMKEEFLDAGREKTVFQDDMQESGQEDLPEFAQERIQDNFLDFAQERKENIFQYHEQESQTDASVFGKEGNRKHQVSSGSMVSPEDKKQEYERYLSNKGGAFTIGQLEEAMQKIMDEYAGGISNDYRYSEAQLEIASEKIGELEPLVSGLSAENMDDLMRIYELRERLVVCRVLIAHLAARKETRWHSFAENTDYPEASEQWLKYVNSRMADGEIQMVYRSLVTGGYYEHSDSEG